MDKSINSKTIPKSLVASVSVSAFLIGKAQKDFWNWYLLPETLSEHKLSSVFKYSNENAIKVSFLARSKTEQQSLIIKWFDSIGFYIKIYPHLGGGQNVFYPSFIFRDEKYNENERNVTLDNGELYYSVNRQEAINEVIKKANIIYNEMVV
jgi:hypothetical protein